MPTVIRLILNESHSMWKQRSKDRHKPTKGKEDTAARTKAEREATYLYSVRNKVLPEDVKGFEIPLHARINNMDTYMLQNWVLVCQRL